LEFHMKSSDIAPDSKVDLKAPLRTLGPGEWLNRSSGFIASAKDTAYTVAFYHLGNPYYEFTNFFAPDGGIIIDDKPWITTEHYFQAQKFASNPIIVEFMRTQLITPRDAFDFARNPNSFLDQFNNWGRITIPSFVPMTDLLPHRVSLAPESPWHTTTKLAVMKHALLAKFRRPELWALLDGTGNKTLIEDAGSKDAAWGNGPDGLGTNYLGRFLMQVRNELRLEFAAKSAAGAKVDSKAAAPATAFAVADTKERSAATISSNSKNSILQKEKIQSYNLHPPIQTLTKNRDLMYAQLDAHLRADATRKDSPDEKVKAAPPLFNLAISSTSVHQDEKKPESRAVTSTVSCYFDGNGTPLSTPMDVMMTSASLSRKDGQTDTDYKTFLSEQFVRILSVQAERGIGVVILPQFADDAKNSDLYTQALNDALSKHKFCPPIEEIIHSIPNANATIDAPSEQVLSAHDFKGPPVVTIANVDPMAAALVAYKAAKTVGIINPTNSSASKFLECVSDVAYSQKADHNPRVKSGAVKAFPLPPGITPDAADAARADLEAERIRAIKEDADRKADAKKADTTSSRADTAREAAARAAAKDAAADRERKDATTAPISTTSTLTSSVVTSDTSIKMDFADPATRGKIVGLLKQADAKHEWTVKAETKAGSPVKFSCNDAKKSEFDVHRDKIETQKENNESFYAMLVAFKALHTGKDPEPLPRIATYSNEAKAEWKLAIDRAKNPPISYSEEQVKKIICEVKPQPALAATAAAAATASSKHAPPSATTSAGATAKTDDTATKSVRRPSMGGGGGGE
jgi:predicted NAD-dependent protein-ADP-ribosyltransferase YbiA (DUF1768 family)